MPYKSATIYLNPIFNNIVYTYPIHTWKESNNLDESMVLGVQEGDYIIYLDDKAKRMKKRELEELILNLSSKVARIYRLSERRLRDWQKHVEDRTPYFISQKNLKKLSRIKKIAGKNS